MSVLTEEKEKVSLITDEIRASASEIYYGNDICEEKSKWLLKEMGLPSGLLPLKDMEEVGYVKETGFVWLKQKQKIQHTWVKLGRETRYSTEVTSFVEKHKIKKLTGVKTKEMMMWVSLSEISFDPPTGKITFKTPAGLFRTFPADAFEIEEEKGKESGGGGGVGEGKEIEVK
ncbi:hypothetical protein LguiB_021566 [Lonicera macranthoides]